MKSGIFHINKFTGWHMAIVMVLFFGTIITVNMTLAYYANKSWTGLVVKNSYVASQAFDENTALRKAQLALGWKIESFYAGGLFSVVLNDAEGKPIEARQVLVMLGRPTTEVDDREVVLNAEAAGRYSGKSELASGLWQADVTVEYGNNEVWNRALRFTVME